MQNKKSILTEALVIIVGALILAVGVWYYHLEQPKGGGPAFFKESTSSQVFFGEGANIPSPSPSVPEATSSVANPASTFCATNGGTLAIRTAPGDGQYGICIFQNGRECEEWAMLRGDCPIGGVDISGYNTPAAAFCALTGGVYRVTKTIPEVPLSGEQGVCGFKSGATCDVWQLYQGKCSPTNQGKTLNCPEWVNCMPGPVGTLSRCVIPPGCEDYTQKAY